MERKGERIRMAHHRHKVNADITQIRQQQSLSKNTSRLKQFKARDREEENKT